MANTHSFINTTRCVCWDVDAFNACGIGATDFDNGQFVTRGAMALKAPTGGYEFAVAAPGANATNLWVIDTPEVGSTVEMQIFDDPRYFYNPAGQPMSIKYLRPEVDFIEVPASAFAAGSTPVDQPTYTFASVNTTVVWLLRMQLLHRALTLLSPQSTPLISVKRLFPLGF